MRQSIQKIVNCRVNDFFPDNYFEIALLPLLKGSKPRGLSEANRMPKIKELINEFRSSKG